MKQFVVIALFALCISSGFGKNIGPQSFHPNDVISFFAENSFADASPSDSSNCFAYYMPILNKISEDTQAANQACSQQSQEELTAAAATANNLFQQIKNESADLTSLLNSCNKQSDTSDGLSCYVNEGDGNIPNLSKISNDARTAIREFNQQMAAVNETLETCNAEVSSESQAATQEVYAYLMGCMQTGAIVTINPQVTISTAAPTTVKQASTITQSQTPTTVVPTSAKVTETAGPVVVAKTTQEVTTPKASTINVASKA